MMPTRGSGGTQDATVISTAKRNSKPALVGDGGIRVADVFVFVFDEDDDDEGDDDPGGAGAAVLISG